MRIRSVRFDFNTNVTFAQRSVSARGFIGSLRDAAPRRRYLLPTKQSMF